MSKIGIISDIHGNYPALKAVIDELERQNCNKIICLGDIAGYYCMINECVSLIFEKGIFCLKGNHDSYLLGESSCPRSRSAADCIRYQQGIIKNEYMKWFKSLKPVYINGDFFAVHGGLDDPLDEYIEEFDFDKAQKISPQSKIFLSGHSHIQNIQSKEKVIYCNPGSVGQPRDYNPKAAYAVLDDGVISLFRTEYNIDEIAKSMDCAGFSDYYYRNLYKGCRIGEVN